jgi:hypothetical protein
MFLSWISSWLMETASNLRKGTSKSPPPGRSSGSPRLILR